MLKYCKFQDCINALEKSDYYKVEALLNSFDLSSAGPKAIALAKEIKSRVSKKKTDRHFNLVDTKKLVNHSIKRAEKPAKQGQDFRNHSSRNFRIDDKNGVTLSKSYSNSFNFINNLEFFLSKLDLSPPLPGISLVSACMNREKNLLKVLDSWLSTDVDEIVIVDWSSDPELLPRLAGISDPRIKIVRIDGEKRWILSHAFNVGLRIAEHEIIFKVDSDIELLPNFFKLNTPDPGEFVRGFWKSGLEQGGVGQQYINGTFGAYKKDLRDANYYDERILTYGWDDSDLYMRLTHDLGLVGRLVIPSCLKHLDQLPEHRIRNQSVSKNRFMDYFDPVEYEGAKNKYYSSIAGDWKSYPLMQDYKFSHIGQRLYRGVRITDAPSRIPEYYRLSEILAARDLAVWSSPTMSNIVNSVDEIDIWLSNLLREAHELDKSRDLVDRIKQGKGVFFIHCGSDLCQRTLHKTLQLIHSHYLSFTQWYFLTVGSSENISVIENHDNIENVFIVPRELLTKLAKLARAKEIKFIEDFEERLKASVPEAYYLSISLRSLAIEAITKSVKISEKLNKDYESPTSSVTGSCLVVSIYDEHNLIRLIEFISCVVLNLRVFERIVLYYEHSNGLISSVLSEVIEEFTLPPGRLILLPCKRRPTFKDLFSIQNLFPKDTIFTVANADIIFDRSFSKIKPTHLLQTIVSLSRRDISKSCENARLVRSRNGAPNTLSADAWVFSTPCDPDFFIDYLIGTMQCDSFINHQISTSSTYKVINPCLDIKLFHLHDDRFNSSTEKQKKKEASIQKNYELEKARIGGTIPVKGIAWTTLEGSKIVPASVQVHQWNPRAIILNFAKYSEPTFGHLLLMHLLIEKMKRFNDVAIVIQLRQRDLTGGIGELLYHYQAHFMIHNFLVDLYDHEFDNTNTPADVLVCQSIEVRNIARWFSEGTIDSINKQLIDPISIPFRDKENSMRLEVIGNISTEETMTLINTLKRKNGQTLTSFINFFAGLPEGSTPKKLITPFFIPLMQNRSEKKTNISSLTKIPAISFITSLFKGGVFLQGFLENVLVAARKVAGEIIIVDANNDIYDSLVVKDFIKKHNDAYNIIKYIQLENDPGLYECWKIAIKQAKADLITNANIDDRRCPQHTLKLIQILKDHPEYAGACGSLSSVRCNAEGNWFDLVDNEVWFCNEPIKEIGFKDLYRRNNHGEFLSRNVMHCMPVWRKYLHNLYGFFDEDTYGTSADWAFWLKCTKSGERFIFEKSAFGRYYLNPESHNRRNDSNGFKEKRIIEDFIGVVQGSITKQ